MERYYFLLCAFPSLSIGTIPEISQEFIDQLIRANVREKDFRDVFLFRLYQDLCNLKFLWSKKPIQLGGNFQEQELESILLKKEIFPSYVFDFMEKHEDRLYRLKNFSYLISRFLQEQSDRCSGFLSFYFRFEREWKIILTALRAKNLKRDLRRELQYEDLTDPLVEFFLAQEEREVLEVPSEFEELKVLFLKHDADPIGLYRHFLEYKFQKIEEISKNYFFTKDNLLAYLAKFSLVQEWAQLSEERGKKVLESLEKGI